VKVCGLQIGLKRGLHWLKLQPISAGKAAITLRALVVNSVTFFSARRAHVGLYSIDNSEKYPFSLKSKSSDWLELSESSDPVKLAAAQRIATAKRPLQILAL